MPPTAPSAPLPVVGNPDASTCDQIIDLGREINANQYRIVHLAARYDDELDWFQSGHKNPAHGISAQLGIHAGTVREWIRVGHALPHLPAIDHAFATNQLSYAKVRILTRWATADNESGLLVLAHDCSADRLTTAIARLLANDDETDEERDARLHDARALTTWTEGDGMTIIRLAVPPSIAKPILAAVDEVARRIAATPLPDEEPSSSSQGDIARRGRDAAGDHDRPDVEMSSPPSDELTQGGRDATADSVFRRSVAKGLTEGGQHPSTDSFSRHSVRSTATTGKSNGNDNKHAKTEKQAKGPAHLPRTLVEIRRRWQPENGDDRAMPSLAQQRADAFLALFLGLDVDITTEVVIHVRGDGTTFDDGTPTTGSSVIRHLPGAFIRGLIHDAECRPVNASPRRRHPTTAQKRVVLEAHNHECIDCGETDLLELDHDPPYQQSRRTVTDELEPRCAPCHRARHRFDHRRAA